MLYFSLPLTSVLGKMHLSNEIKMFPFFFALYSIFTNFARSFILDKVKNESK